MTGDQGMPAATWIRTEAAGQPVDVGVHLAAIAGRVQCVGLDLRTANGKPITTMTVRRLRTAAVIEEAGAQVRDLMKVVLEGVPEGTASDTNLLMQAAAMSSVFDYVGEPAPAPKVDQMFEPAPAKRRRGPRPLLDDDALRGVVAPAYATGGSRPVQAVLQALIGDGRLGGHVTIDQARKAVTSARTRGFIPPATGRGARRGAGE